MRKIIAGCCIFLGLCGLAIADGKMYTWDGMPPEIPYQRALIMFRDSEQVLMLQSQYRMPDMDDGQTLGWVVPVPSVPEVASMDAAASSTTFLGLASLSRPKIISVQTSILLGVFLMSVGFGALLLILLPLSFVPVLSPSLKPYRRSMLRGLGACIITIFLVVLASSSAGRLLHSGIEVIDTASVGVYDVQIVRSDHSSALIDWLRSQDYAFDEKDVAVFDQYIASGWCFVTARITSASELRERGGVDLEGMAAPLILRFSNHAPIYPLALTGAGAKSYCN